MAKVTDFLHRTLWLAYAALAAMAAAFVLMLMDRDIPFRVEPTTPSHVQAGHWAFINIPVWRNPEQRCSVTFSRYIFDAEGARFDISGMQQASAATIRRLEKNTPGRLLIKVMIPPAKSESVPQGIALGPASLVTSLSYVCNRAQRFWPVEVETEIPLIVEP